MTKREESLLWPCFCFKSNMMNFETLLHVAAQACDIDWTRQLLVRGADANVIDHHSKTPLHYAIDLDQFDIIKLLLKTNIDINVKDKDQLSTPLHYAVKNNRFTAVDLLLEAGARIDIHDNNFIPPLQLPFQNRHIDYLQLIIDARSANPVKNILFYPATHLAAFNGYYELYWLMFNKYNISINLRDQTCSTVLHYVVKRGDLEEVKRLVLAGADVNILDDRNWNALQYAIHSGFTSLAIYLVENGTVENRQCLEHHSPLYLAAFCRHTEILKRVISVYSSTDSELLWNIVLRSSIIKNDRDKIICALEMGARLDSFSTQLEISITKPGLAALHLAVQKSTIDELNILLQQPQVDVNIVDDNGWTPLHYCAYYNRENTLNFLVDHYHVDIDVLTNKNENAFFLALSRGHINLAINLLNRGTKLNFNRVYGEDKTLLEHAIILKTIDFVQLFLNMGANPNFSFDTDRFPMRLAIDCGSLEIVQCLISNGADAFRIFKFVERDRGPYWQLNDPFRVRYHEWKILSYVAYKCKSKIMKYLIEECRFVNPSWQTDPVIISAFAKGISMHSYENLTDIFETFNVLLQAGYNVHIQDELTGKYPIHIICETIITCVKNTELAIALTLQLIHFKANINAKDSFHRTALHIIASDKDNHRHLYQILLKLGASKYSVDSDGHIPEDIAMIHDESRRVSLFSYEKLRSKSKFYLLSARIHLTKNDLIELLNNNVKIRKLLPYSTKNLKQIESIENRDITKHLQTINDKHVLSEYLLDWVLKQAVQFKADSEELEIRNTIHHLLNDLLIEMAYIDDRFSDSQLIPSGSGFEGFKMDKPDEFDFLYEFGKSDFIAEETIHFVPTNDPCYVKIIVNDIKIRLKWKDFIDDNEHLLNASKLRLYIVLLMQQASLTNKFRFKCWEHQYLRFNLVPYHENCLSCATLINQSKVGAILHVEWNGKKYEKLYISIDIAPAIPIMNQWPSNAKKHSLPVIEIDDLIQWGYHVVTKADYNLCNMFAWRISFSLCEYQIFSRLNLCQSACFAILKLIRIPFEDTLTSWMWKSMFFQQLKITVKNDWNIERLSERVSNCLSCIWPNELTIDPHSVQSFFIQDQIIDPTDSTRSYNVKNIFFGLCYLKLIQKQFFRIIKNA